MTEPLAAVLALALVCVAVSAYAGLLDTPGITATPPDEAAADRTLRETYRQLATAGVVDPGAVGFVSAPGTDRTVRVRLRSGDLARAAGPDPPAGAAAASRRVAVRHGPGHVEPGRLVVRVW